MAGPLRHGREAVGVSTLAGQWYCELKVELSLRHPEILPVLPALDLGTEGHRQISADAISISREQFESDVAEGKEIFLQESRFAAEIEGVPVVGVPDLVHLKGRRCELVLEMKFSKRPNLYIDRFIQAQAYGLLLAGNGYAMEDAACVVGVVPAVGGAGRAEKLEALKKGGLLHEILDRCRALREDRPRTWASRGLANPVTLRHGGATLQAFPYDGAEALRHLRWAFEYWRGLREPRPADSVAKCRVCPYNAVRVCAEAKGAADAGFRVRRDTGDGRDVVEVSWRK